MTLDIKVKESRGPEPVPLPPPGLRERTTIVGPAKDPPPGLAVFVEKRTRDGLLERADSGGEMEVGGFLLGGLHSHGGRRYIDITHQVPATTARGGRAHLTFDNDTLREFHATHAQRYPGTLVLGWWHTHPGYGLFLSSDDLFIHRSFYALEHHVAVVIDPFAGPKENLGVFTWGKGGVSDDAYDLVVYEVEREPVVRAHEAKRREKGSRRAAPPPLPQRPKESAEWTPRPRDSSRRKRGGA